MSTNPDGSPFQVVLSTGEIFVVSTPLRPGRDFFGITTESAIASLRFTATAGPNQIAGIPLIDNFAFGEADPSTAPEPAALALLGTGLGAMTARAWRRRRTTGTRA